MSEGHQNRHGQRNDNVSQGVNIHEILSTIFCCFVMQRHSFYDRQFIEAAVSLEKEGRHEQCRREEYYT